jgi:hypothetical protein
MRCAPPPQGLTDAPNFALNDELDAGGADLVEQLTLKGLHDPEAEAWVLPASHLQLGPVISAVGQAFDVHQGTLAGRGQVGWLSSRVL